MLLVKSNPKLDIQCAFLYLKMKLLNTSWKVVFYMFYGMFGERNETFPFKDLDILPFYLNNDIFVNKPNNFY